MPEDEFRQHYRSLSEEGLREIDPADLTAAARACYDEELASRGLIIESTPPAAIEPAPAEITWVPLDTFPPEEIKLIRALLAAEEIPTTMEPPSTGNYPPSAAGSVVFVPEPLLERAQEALSTQISDEELIAEAEAYQPSEDA